MIQAFYKIKYGDYKKYCHKIPSCVGHSTDEKLTDDSTITLKVTGEDHIHHWLEQQEGVEPIEYPGHTSVTVLSHPIMKFRGAYSGK